MRKFLEVNFIIIAFGLLAFSAQAGTSSIDIKGSVSASQNGCVIFVGLFGSPSCSSNQDGELEYFGAPDGLGAPSWGGPFYGGGFYKTGQGPGASDPGGFIPGGKERPKLDGTITIDDQGDADPTNDVIGGTIKIKQATMAFSGGQTGPFAEATWKSLTYTIAAKTADSATVNQWGGVDYVIGSLGMPENLIEIGIVNSLQTDPSCGPGLPPALPICDDALPGGPGTPAPSEIGAGGRGFYQGPGTFSFDPTVLNDTPGIASYESSQPKCAFPGQVFPSCAPNNIGTTATGVFKNLVCVDIAATTGACTSAASITADPDIDNLTMFISTNAAGKILRGNAFASREFDIAGLPPGPLFVPDGVPDSFNYTTMEFSSP